MLKLILLNPQASTQQKEWDFDYRNTIRVGRSPDNDVVLNDPLVSRYHLELGRIGETPEWQIVNKGTNGTFIDGILVSRTVVSHDTVIQLARGGPTLKLQIRQSAVAPPPSNHPTCTHADNPLGNLFCIHCGQPLVKEVQHIHHYQVLKTLGQGGMGTTYLALDTQASHPGQPKMLVLKEMNADMAQIEKARELFEREARILQGLHHPGIPRFYDFFVDSSKKYLAMELIHGQDLEKRIYQLGPVGTRQAIEWMIQTCDVLAYIHSQNPPLIHRDIKPANLMMRYVNNRVVVLDFGAVKEIGTPPGTRIGAEGYCAPEQYRGQPCTQSDLYAIGPTIIFLVSGRNPMDFYRPSGLGYRFDIQTIPTIPPQLAKVIERVTETKVRDRYQTAQELSQALQACL